MKGTFNTLHFGNGGSFGGNFPVWARIEHRLAGGGYFDLTETNPLTGETFKAGDLIPAGTMVKYTKPGAKLTIVANDAVSVEGVNGFVDNDVLIPENCALATAAVVTAGRIYADRVIAKTVGLPTEVEANLPMIEFVRE